MRIALGRRTSLKGNLRCSKIFRNSCPTAPVTPAMAMLGRFRPLPLVVKVRTAEMEDKRTDRDSMPATRT